VLNPGGAERFYCAGGFRPNRIGDGEQSADMSLVADGDNGLSFALKGFRTVMDLWRFLPALLEIAVGAEPEALSFEHSAHAL